MPRVTVFNHLTLDGFISDQGGDMSWAHRDPSDREWGDFVQANAGSGGMLLFGRVTYEMMASWWPTAQAKSSNPVVAERMNGMPKIVFSRTMKKAGWENTRLVSRDPAEEVRDLKAGRGPDMAVLGSGVIAGRLLAQGLVDELKVVVNPVMLGGGKSMYGGIASRLPLRLSSSRVFTNGNVLLCYVPA